MKKRYVHVLIIAAICGLLAVVFSGKESLNAKPAAKVSSLFTTVGKRPVTQLTDEKKSETHTPPTVVISNGVFVVDTREKLVYGTPTMEKYRAGDQQQAALHGAEAKVTLRVVDTEGKAVTEASVNLTFAFRQKNKPLIGLTDSNGLFVAQGTLTDDIIYRVSKIGYYETFDRFFMAKAATRCVENGRWIPWNPVLQVTMKEIRKPIPMYVKKVECKLPKYDVPIGFDFKVGDWVAPYGKGLISDMTLTYSETEREDSLCKYDFKVTFPSPSGGAYIQKKDLYSILGSANEATSEGYSPSRSFVYERTDSKIIQDVRVTSDDCLVFRSRTETDELGVLQKANYGKIYGPLKFADGRDREVVFTYYFNPTPNDRNLEFDGKNNLFNPKWNEPDSAIVLP